MYLHGVDIHCPASSPATTPLWRIIIFVLFVTTTSSMVGASPPPQRQLARFTSRTTIENLLLLSDKERVVLGAVNHLYSLNSTGLRQLEDVEIGPVLDSPLCDSELASCIDNRVSIREWDNHVKVLHYVGVSGGGDADGGTVLVCGSVRQGTCQLRALAALGRQVRHPNFPLHFRHQAVAANAPNASTVSMLSADRERLYVAASYAAHDSPYRGDSFPAVATRLAPSGLLPINSGSIEGEAAVFIRAEYRQRFNVKYIDGFFDGKHAYWASVQPKYVQPLSPVTNPLVTKLIRVCKDDERYVSYSEIELQCRSADDNTNFNILRTLKLHRGEVLIAAFSDADGTNSAVCLFSMAKVRTTYWYNIDRCRAGTDSIGLAHIGRDAKCINKSHLPLAEDTCELGIGGSIEASQVAALQYTNKALTSVEAAVVDGRDLVLAGTSQGAIIQFELTGEHNKRRLRKYTDYAVAESAISRLQVVDGSESFLAVADKELLLLRLSSCSSGAERPSRVAGDIESCNSCISAGDPLCGWCLEKGSCTRRSECQSGGGTLLVERCPRLVGELEPRNASVLATAESRVLVPLRDLPRPPSSSENLQQQQREYECYFGLFKSASVQWTSGGIQCQLPKQRPKISASLSVTPSHADSLQVPLTLRMARSRVNLLSQNFTFFDCSLHTVCSACGSSPWQCRWCTAEHRCLNPTDEPQGGRCSGAESQAAVHCPRIDTDSTPEILIADATNASLTLNVLNMKHQPEDTTLFCEVHRLALTDGTERTVRTPAKLFGTNKLQCVTAFYATGNSSSEGLANHTLSLTNGKQTIDEIPVTLYTCSRMAVDCSKCLSLDPKWHCSWCDGACRYHGHCSATAISHANSQTDQLCTPAVIESFYPESAPSEGGTLVEIRGRDLGSRLADVQDRVLVAGARCRVVDYEVSTLVRCITEKAAVGSTGPIRVTIGKSGRRSVASKTHFRFVDPQPRSIYPQFGPQSGGTQLTIHGDNLNAGRNITVHLDNLPCEVRGGSNGAAAENEEMGRDQITCVTSASSRIYSTTSIRIQIDGALRLLHGSKFTYRADPSVFSIHPLTAYEGGGRVLTVSGSNFDSLLSAKIYLLSSGDAARAEIVSQLGQCQIVNATAMNCLSPKLTLRPPETAEKTSYGRWPVGFVMDGVTHVRNLGRRLQLATVPNPQFQPFAGVKLQRVDQPLVIHGSHLSQAASVDDYEVTIGTEVCRVFVLDSAQLLCHPPVEREPSATDDHGAPLPGDRPLVVVKVGGVRAELGLIELDGYAGSLVFGVRIGLAKLALLVLSSLSLLTFTVVALFWLWRRRGSEHERDYKRIQLQMEQMESSVRNECKQAFAELQTDVMGDFHPTLDDHLSPAGIPFHERAEFIARLLFPRDTNHLLHHHLRNNATHSSGNDSACGGSSGDGSHHYGSGSYGSNNTQHMPMALAQFEQLLRNSQFLFLLVQMVEADESVSLQERSSLASLLVASLDKDMAYLSEIVLALLSAHIERAVLSKSSHLLFRNSNSVVEKLFQLWFAICLHPYVVDSAGPGRHLYLLYRAVKCQVDRGPVDAVSGEARYSLSEQKLLRDWAVDAAPITLRVMPSEGFEQVPVLCQVLSCDTIGQVKAKLLDYCLCRNQPHSARLRADQFELEWRCPKRGSVLLMDDDRPAVKGVKRLNTVGHYQLSNNSLLAMQTRSSQTFTFRSGSSDTTCSAWSSAHLLLDDSGSGSSPLGGGAGSNNGYDTSYYHLTSPPPSNGHANGGGFCVTSASRKVQHHRRQQVASGHVPSAPPPSGCVEAPTKTIPEVFLTRLLMCKGAIQRFVEAFFDSVTQTEPTPEPPLCVGCDHATAAPVPIVMKYVVDFLDAEAQRNGMTDPDVLHAWKTNALILRFWMQLLHNPNTLLDVQRQRHLQPSLAVIGQTLVDTFSRSDLLLGKESPSSKLLFAKEISRYRPLAAQMYRRIAQHQPAISPQQFFAYVSSIPTTNASSCGVSRAAAVSELLNWVKANGLSLLELLERDPVAIKQRLGERLRQIVHCSLVESEHIYATLQ